MRGMAVPCLGLAWLAGSMMAWGSTAADSGPSLEEVTVYATQVPGNLAFGGTVVTQEDMQLLERNTVDQALLLASGTATSLVGARNETDIWIRGFDRWRVPLYQDGIPVYLPYDDRIDFGRFTTIDLAEIQVSKGFASVIDGPGAMGGSINLVSRVVQRPLEAEARYGMTVDRSGQYEGSTADMFVGTRQSDWFAQVAGSFTHDDGFELPADFTPGTLQPSGERIESFHQDWKLNLKAGYEPSPGTQYSVNFIDQVGEKGNPPPDGIIPQADLSQAKFWTWPAWDKQSAYWLSQTALDAAGSYLKTRLYYDRFYNVLDSYDTASYTTQNTPKSFDSTYDDRAAGTSVELAEVLAGGVDTVRVAGHFRWDQHNETELTRNAPGAPQYQEPWETAEETTSSLAVENILRPAQHWQVIAGASYDYRHLIGDSEWLAEGVTPPFGESYAYPVSDKHAANGELAAIYDYSDTGAVHLSYADRTRFPTLFEMYSTRFNTFVNNPDLKPERSHYGQIGIADTVLGTHVVVNAFLARIDDAIVSVALSPTLSQSENIGAERQEGYEIELSRALTASLSAVLNFSALTRIEIDSDGVPPTDTPSHRLFAYLDWHPLPALAIVPSVDMEGPRWLQNAVINTLYYHTGSYTLVGIKAAYQVSHRLQLDVGVNNLLDRNYLLEDSYNGPGRQYYANVRYAL